jgi:flagellar M-ring protein FliF
MNQLLEKVRTQGKQILDGFTPGQKAMTGLAVLVVLVGGYLFTSWAGKPAYAPLFTGLEPSAAAEVTEALDSAGTPYQLADGGRSIMVPKDDVYASRIALSAEGLPSSAENGWGILEDQGITASEFRQRVDFQRALEGELTNTIRAIKGVQGAEVHLVIPKEDLFTEDQQKATASVLLDLRNGTALDARQVQTVVNLVASSVEGLNPRDVAVSDTDGTPLSVPGEDGADMAAGDFRAQQTASYERRTAEKLRTLLASIVGPAGAQVIVSAELDFDDRKTESQTYGDAPQAIRITETGETFTGSSAPPGGVLGPDGGPVEGGDTNDYGKNGREEERVVDTTVETVDNAPGSLVRQSISVLVDTERAQGVALETIEEQVATAAGIVAGRGDTISVARADFDTTIEDQQEQRARDAAAAERWDSLFGGLRSIATVLFVGFGLLLAYRRLRRPLPEEEIPIEHLALESGDGELLELDDEDIVEMEPARNLVAIEGNDDPSTVLVSRRHRRELDRLPGLEERMAENADIADLIDRQPDDVAQLLRGWMAERR